MIDYATMPPEFTAQLLLGLLTIGVVLGIFAILTTGRR